MSAAVIFQRPEAAAQQLMLLFHGVGGSARDLETLGRRLAHEFPQATIVGIDAPDRCASGTGRQWYPMEGIGDDNRVERLASAMPAFLATIEHWQRIAQVGHAATALVGFSQGGLMALESTRDRAPPAGRVVAIGARFARLPETASLDVTLHLLHGKLDRVIPYAHTVEAAQRVIALGGDITADVLPFVGHQVNAQVVSRLIERLRTHVPKRCWEEALKADPGQVPPGAAPH